MKDAATRIRIIGDTKGKLLSAIETLDTIVLERLEGNRERQALAYAWYLAKMAQLQLDGMLSELEVE